MRNTFSFSIRLIISTLLLGVLSACGGGGGSSDNDPPPPPPPPANQPPVLDAIGAQTVEEAQTLNFSASATDAESTPELSVSGLPSGATFDAASGTFNWVTAAGDAAGSPYEVTFTATDSAGLTDTENVNITVTVPPNQTPVLTPIGNQGAQETQALSFTVTATDEESTPVLDATGLPMGSTFDPASGAFAWTPSAGDAAASPYLVTFTATDDVDNSLTATETVTITVAPEACTEFPSVAITAPEALHLQTSTSLEVQTLTCFNETHTGWGVKFVLDNAGTTADEAIVNVGIFSQTFTDVAQADYTLRAVVVDDLDAEVTGTTTQAEVTPVGIGDYYIAIGDSITVGRGDDESSDDTSLDGRNTGSGEPLTGGGYTPILNNLLTAALGYPHTVIAVAAQGTTSAEGAMDTPAALAAHPDAQRVLVKYGMNDAGPPFIVPSGLGLNPGDGGYPGSFKANMQQIIDAITIDGKEAILAKINIARGDSADSGRYVDADIELGARNVEIQGYNMVIDELRTENSISIEAPDFYDLFLTNMRFNRQYADNIHPNGIGYQNMAELWSQILIP